MSASSSATCIGTYADAIHDGRKLYFHSVTVQARSGTLTLVDNNILFERAPSHPHIITTWPVIVSNVLTWRWIHSTQIGERAHQRFRERVNEENTSFTGLLGKTFTKTRDHRLHLNLSPLSARRRTNTTRVTLLNRKNIRHSSCVDLWELEPDGFLKLHHISSLSLPPSIYLCNIIGRGFVKRKQ